MVTVVVSLPLAGAPRRALWMHFSPAPSPVGCLLGGLWGSAAYTLLCDTKGYCFPFDLGSTRTAGIPSCLAVLSKSVMAPARWLQSYDGKMGDFN